MCTEPVHAQMANEVPHRSNGLAVAEISETGAETPGLARWTPMSRCGGRRAVDRFAIRLQFCHFIHGLAPADSPPCEQIRGLRCGIVIADRSRNGVRDDGTERVSIGPGLPVGIVEWNARDPRRARGRTPLGASDRAARTLRPGVAVREDRGPDGDVACRARGRKRVVGVMDQSARGVELSACRG
jgi:hypothetical protein